MFDDDKSQWLTLIYITRDLNTLLNHFNIDCTLRVRKLCIVILIVVSSLIYKRWTTNKVRYKKGLFVIVNHSQILF